VAPPKKVLGRDGPHDLATFSRVVSINLIGTFNMIRLAAEAMSKNEPNEGGERGVIVNTASIAAFDGQIGQAAYASSKAGGGRTDPAGGTRAGRARHPRRDDRAGHIWDTDDEGIAAARSGYPEQDGAVPKSRLGYPAEYAALVRHICENTYLNGEVIRLDGAIRMPGK
jgi:NAD(P)-dependent dehydrogenase (short-subunit alcohol dehydrogenase family)